MGFGLYIPYMKWKIIQSCLKPPTSQQSQQSLGRILEDHPILSDYRWSNTRAPVGFCAPWRPRRQDAIVVPQHHRFTGGVEGGTGELLRGWMVIPKRQAKNGTSKGKVGKVKSVKSKKSNAKTHQNERANNYGEFTRQAEKGPFQ